MKFWCRFFRLFFEITAKIVFKIKLASCLVTDQITPETVKGIPNEMGIAAKERFPVVRQSKQFCALALYQKIEKERF